VIVRVDVLPVILEARRVMLLEVIGGFHGQAQLGRWWLPSGVLQEGEQPVERARAIVRAQLGMELEGTVVVGSRAMKVGPDAQLALVYAGEVIGDTPEPGLPASGYAARTLAELPDQVGFWHRDDLGVLLARYERLRA
jgi:hypothetical protein